jgi:hypothetical protein
VARKRGAFEGGVTISKSQVNTGGGDIVGRDNIRQSAAHQLEGVFQPVSAAIARADPTVKSAAEAKLQALKQEVVKGKPADDPTIAKLVEGLVGLVPAAVSAIVAAFATPILGGVAGPATKYVLDKIRGL